MTVKTIIVDPATGLQANVINHYEENSLVVATRELKSYENSIKYFTNDTYGIDMNQNALATGTPVLVHDGIDTVAWTGSNINGTVTFNSATVSYNGTNSIDFTAWTVAGHTCQIAKGSDQDLSGYSTLTMYLYVSGNWTADSISVYGWDTGTGMIIGNKVFLEDYANVNVYNTWHSINIPLSDMGLENLTIDSIRFQYEVKDIASVNFYIDDIEIQETSGSIRYSLKPERNTWLYIYNFTFTIANDISLVLADSSVPKLDYSKFFGETLANGIVYSRLVDNEIKFRVTFLNILDTLELPNTEIKTIGTDGTNSFITIQASHQQHILLKYEDRDEIDFSISDDLSGLLRFRITAGCKIEYRTMHGKYEYYRNL